MLLHALLLPVLSLKAGTPVTHHQAKAHPMRYHLALPDGWVPGRRWPVVVVIPDAHRDFEANLRRFIAARGARPFILVAPEVPTCGGTRDETSPPYSYTAAERTAIKAAGEFEFDDAGLAAVLKEIQAQWGGGAKAFLTGWEAGGHTVWAQALRRPERWGAVAPVDSNFQGRGLGEGAFSTAKARAALPLKAFWCGAPTGEVAQAMHILRQQTQSALDSARAHGFAPLPEEVVQGRDHGPLPEAVLAWFESLSKAMPD